MKLFHLIVLGVAILINAYIAYTAYNSTIKAVDMEKMPIIRKCDCLISALHETSNQPLEKSIYDKINNNAKSENNILSEKTYNSIGKSTNEVEKKLIEEKKDGVQDEIFRILSEKQEAKLQEIERQKEKNNQVFEKNLQENRNLKLEDNNSIDDQTSLNNSNKTLENIFDLIDQ